MGLLYRLTVVGNSQKSLFPITAVSYTGVSHNGNFGRYRKHFLSTLPVFPKPVSPIMVVLAGIGDTGIGNIGRNLKETRGVTITSDPIGRYSRFASKRSTSIGDPTYITSGLLLAVTHRINLLDT